MKKIIILFSMLVLLVGCTNDIEYPNLNPEIEFTSIETTTNIYLNVAKFRSGEFSIPLLCDRATATSLVNGSNDLLIDSVEGEDVKYFDLTIDNITEIYSYFNNENMLLKVTINVSTSSNWESNAYTKINKITFNVNDTKTTSEVNVEISSLFDYILIDECYIASYDFLYYCLESSENVKLKLFFREQNFSNVLDDMDTYINIINVYSQNDNIKINNIIMENPFGATLDIIPDSDNIADVVMAGSGTTYFKFDVTVNDELTCEFVSDNIIVEYKLPGSDEVRSFMLCNLQIYNINW